MSDRKSIPLQAAIDALPRYFPPPFYGKDIEEAHGILLADRSVRLKRKMLRRWLATSQPCLLGRLAAHGRRGLAVDICWIEEVELNMGVEYLRTRIQSARRRWKARAARGVSSGFLIMFNSARLAFARPGPALVEISCQLASLYFEEHDPIQPDTIYSEAVPLWDEQGSLVLFKAGVNIFYTGAHETRNHDRRIPGGLLISVNSPGHYANALVVRGLMPSLEDAITFIRNLAVRSIGNGGIGTEAGIGTSWHHNAAYEVLVPGDGHDTQV